MSEFSRFSLFKRRNGVYSILYYHYGHRRWKSTNVTTKPEALAALSKFRELLSTSIPSPPVNEFVARFLSYAETIYTPKTLGIYKKVLSRFLRLTGNLFLVELTDNLNSAIFLLSAVRVAATYGLIGSTIGGGVQIGDIVVVGGDE